ncbi:outer membrane beta-barrel protein [candidate division KSB1 bacterium]|nr:outer membrane beta-barrel protein [candidate division KSB1 bacterium]
MKPILMKTISSCIIIFSIFTTSTLAVQRSNGIGLRASFWNVKDQPTQVNTNSFGESGSVNIGGAGGWIYFFSRMHNNWFLEFQLGSVAGVNEEFSSYLVEKVDVTVVLPFLIGLRYDILSPRFPSRIQPYLSTGGGPYWIMHVNGNDAFAGEQEVKSKVKNGLYLGGGMNLMMTSWAALNMDIRYHLVNFSPDYEASGMEFGFGFSVMWGQKRELFQIKAIRPVVSDIYPAYYPFYNLVPLALISIENVAGFPIEVNVKSRIASVSERMKESGFITIQRGKTEDIPISAIFGATIQNVDTRKPAMLDIIVEARAGQTITRNFSTPIMVHSRNAWDGKMDKLSFFLTPEAPQVMEFSRKVMAQIASETDDGPERLAQARHLFDALSALGIRYQSDPTIPFYQDDRVQFAEQTMSLGHGDCDDLVVLYASLLSSIGIKTAFVEVRDPSKSLAHVYLMFDTEVEAPNGDQISTNAKRYIVREDKTGKQTIWIPVETTLLDQGFTEAWNSAALSYLEEAVLRNGMGEGWLSIFDVE